MTFSSEQIIALLRARHSEDVFVTECKDGPSQMANGFSRMDAWAMPRSWAHPAITAYEVKVSRSDFLRDDKWRNYLNCCNVLYFACAPGIISPDELPADVGLLEMSKTGGRLFTRKKAAYRDFTTIEQIRSLESVFRYVLMCRAEIRGEFAPKPKNREFWERVLADKEEQKHYGHRLGRQIREMISRQIDEVKCENDKLKKLMESYEDHRAMLEKMGLSREHVAGWSFERRLKEIKAGVDPDFVRSLKNVAEGLMLITKKLES